MVARSNLTKCSCDGKALHGWAKKAPKVKPSAASSGSSTVNQANLLHESLAAIADKLAKYPEFIKEIHTILFSGDYPLPKSSAATSVWVNDAFTTIGRIPREWMARWLEKRLSTAGLTTEVLSSLEEKDKENIPMLFEAETQLGLGTSLPVSVRADEVVATRFFNRRADSVGSRLTPMLKDKSLTKDKISFKRTSYEIKWTGQGEGCTADTVMHIPSKSVAKVPPHLRIGKDFRLRNNHLDGLASVEKPPVFQHLYGFFDAELPFVKNIVVGKSKSKLLNSLAEDIKDDKDKQHLAEEQARSSGSASILTGAVKKAKETTSAAARAKLADKVKKRHLKREVSYA